MARLDGKVCVITGAGGGMGRDAAILFTQEGAHVCAADVNGAAAEETVGMCADGAAFGFEVNVADEDRVAAMMRATAEGIGVNALCPGPVETPLLLNIFGEDPAALERRRAHWPTGRLAKPREVVNGALFLASDDSSYVNGATFLVDGGLTASYVTPA